MATYNNGVDTVPTPNSTNIIESNAVAVHGNALDISELNKNGSTLATYTSLSEALAAVPASVQRGGMSIKFIQLTPATYSVVKTEGLTEQPTGTEVQEVLVIGTGTYTAEQLSGITLPTSVGNSVTYWMAVSETVDEQEVTTYTTWIISYASAESQEYVQYRLMKTSWSNGIGDWQGIDKEPTVGSNNLVKSGGIADAIGRIFLYADAPERMKNSISELYFPNTYNYIPKITCYNGAASINLFIDGHSTVSVVAKTEYLRNNNIIYPFIITKTDGENYQIGETIGYIVFDDVDTFRVNDGNSIHKDLYLPYVTKLSNFPIIAAFLEKNIDISRLNTKFYKNQISSVPVKYEQGLMMLFIDTNVLPIIFLSTKCYNSGFYAYYKTAASDELIQLNNINLTEINNYDKINLVKDDIVVGYVVFKDKSKFINSPTSDSSYEMNLDLVTNHAFNTIIPNKAISLDAFELSVFDNEPTAGSKNLVKSGSILTSLVNIGKYLKFYDTINKYSVIYEKCLLDVFIDVTKFDVTISTIDLTSYSNKAYVTINKDLSSQISIIVILGSRYVDKQIIPIIYSDIVVGYIVFKDIATFKATQYGGICKLNIAYVTSQLLHHSEAFEPLADKSVTDDKLADKAVTKRSIGFRFFSDTDAISNAYEEGLLDCYVDNSLFAISVLKIWCYNNGLYVLCTLDGENIYLFRGFSFSNVINYEPINLVYNNVIVGYICFSDKSKFTNNNTGSSKTLDLEIVTSMKDLYHSNSFFATKHIGDIINTRLSENLSIVLPDVVYAIVGTELNLWNDTICYCINRGLHTPINYSVSWKCNIGKITSRCYRLKATATQTGNYTLTCRVYDVTGVLAATKTISLRVISKDALQEEKKIVFFGDSTGGSTASALYANFHDTERFSGIAPTMLGSRGGSNVRYDAVGGYSWADYGGPGRAAFRCVVENAPAIPLNAKYTNNGFTWEVVEVNVTDGSGNILITKDSTTYTDHPTSSGTLVAVTPGVSDISYTSYENAPANPLWDSSLNDGEGGLSIEHYKSVIGLASTDKIDAVSFFLGLNGNQSNDVIVSYIKELYNTFVADNSDCKFIIGIITASNSEDGFGVNYGASIPSAEAMSKYDRFNKLYLSLLNDTSLSNLRICPAGNEIDRYYGYILSERAVSDRNTTVEKYHSNAVHPGSSGYAQFGDAFFASYIGVLTE